MRKITMLLLGLSALGSSFIYADQAPTVTVVNATQTNIHYEFSMLKPDGSSGAGGGNSQFTNDPSAYVINVVTGQGQLLDLTPPTKLLDILPTLHINTVDEIDSQNGNTLPNGMKGEFAHPSCTAKVGQTLLLEQAGNKQISCRVIG